MYLILPYLKYTRKLTRSIVTHTILHANTHYDALGLSVKATQLEIKTAYYNLSKIYHPDIARNDREANDKFRAITEAYEVLGNVKSRKLYDKGFGQHIVVDDHVESKFYKSRELRSRPPPPAGGQPVYDFDEWSRNHYGKTFAQDLKMRQRRAQEKEELRQTPIRREHAVGGICMVLLMMWYAADNYDKPVYQRDESRTSVKR